MGKIKETRFRVHPSATNKPHSSLNAQLLESGLRDVSLPKTPFLAAGPNLFSGIDIDISKVATSIKNCDTVSVSGRSHREVKKEEQHLPKKEKIKRRHERFMQKLDAVYAAKKKLSSKRQKKKQRTDDQVPLLMPLTSDIDSAPATPANRSGSTAQPRQSKKKPLARCSMKIKKRVKEDLNDVKHFKKVLNDSMFTRNPAVAIKEFLKQKMSEKRPDLNFE